MDPSPFPWLSSSFVQLSNRYFVWLSSLNAWSLHVFFHFLLGCHLFSPHSSVRWQPFHPFVLYDNIHLLAVWKSLFNFIITISNRYDMDKMNESHSFLIQHKTHARRTHSFSILSLSKIINLKYDVDIFHSESGLLKRTQNAKKNPLQLNRLVQLFLRVVFFLWIYSHPIKSLEHIILQSCCWLVLLPLQFGVGFVLKTG